MTKPKRPRDPNQLAKLIVGIATGEVDDVNLSKPAKDQHAAGLGRLGGKARAASLTKARRSEIAKKAAAKRWEK